MNWTALKKTVLPEICPDENELEELRKTIIALKKCLDLKATKLSIKDYNLEAQGSTGEKQTLLKASADIDLFVILEKSHLKPFEMREKTKKVEIRNYLASLVERWFVPSLRQCECEDIHLSYAEHPYASARKGRFEIDVVACFHLEKEDILKHGVITAVDRTPLHTKLIKSALNKDQINDIRLLKSFFIACRAYGDRAAIGQLGFTGFSAEVLIYHFHTLEQVFAQFHQLKEQPIDFFQRSKEELMKKPDFKKSTLIIIDPTDPTRNLAASISERCFQFVNYKIQKFLSNPSPDHFIPQPLMPLSEDELLDMPPGVVLEFKQTIEDIHYTEVRDKLYSFGRKLSRFLELEHSGENKFGRNDFEVYFEEPDFALYIVTKHARLDKTYLHRGPPIGDSENVKKFQRKHSTAFLKDGFHWVEIERSRVILIEEVREFLNMDFVKSLLGQVECLHITSQGKGSIGKKIVALYMKELIPFFSESNKRR